MIRALALCAVVLALAGCTSIPVGHLTVCAFCKVTNYTRPHDLTPTEKIGGGILDLLFSRRHQ